MSNKSLEELHTWIDDQRWSMEKKCCIGEFVRKAIKEAEEDVRREMQRKIADMQFEYEQKIKELKVPSNAFVAMLRNALEAHPDIIKDAAENIITDIAEDVAEKKVDSHVRSEHNSTWSLTF